MILVVTALSLEALHESALSAHDDICCDQLTVSLNVLRDDLGEVLNLLGIWRSASFADVNQQTGFDEPGKGAPHGDETTCFASHA
jgi:hypothetical protein